MTTYLKQAFDITLPDAEEREPWYVCLMEDCPFYGGPEEGGWWSSDTFCVAAKQCHNKKQAERYAKQVKALAEDMTNDSRVQFGEHCLQTLAWLEERGLEPDFLPEPDGESQFYVTISKGIPEPEYGRRRYE